MAAKKKKNQVNATSTSKEVDSANQLPFEPVRQKASKPTATTAIAQSKTPQSIPKATKGRSSRASTPSSIPEIVSRRMVSRAALYCGVPSVLALLTFVVSYLAIANDVFHPPTAAVLLVSLGFFGLGVLGLSYGPLSASWDEERVGNLIGWNDFKLNFGRLRDSWRTAKAAKED
ncbi:PAM68 family protein [Phormidium sp. FACHB-592]|uniref:PAM68 family protein n=1 Tax=Stenomitos frigidus AS-A4 TaxID=2933935 RepID=A0ABV0KU16_9CYAN|nr:PAM68 family protein [Phormidium sp. FACHB-592]MBD2076783.1 PAM68 family protein [Phormidium sp. FACHB-592]